MHPNPVFHSKDHAKDIAFVRERAFGTLTINGPDVPLMAHVPVMMDETGHTVLLHLVRSNQIARAASEPVSARLAVMGPDAYISPDWYGVQDQVPTWNYVSVEVTGVLQVLPHDQMRTVLDHQSAFFEDRLTKVSWTTKKMTPDVLNRMMRMIVPARMNVTGIAATWKLGQNKDDAARVSAADQLKDGLGSELAALSDLMRHPPKL